MVSSDVLAGARLLARLPGFLRRPIRVDRAREELTRRLERRDAAFVDLVRRTIYARPANPYARLLGHAGCEPGDLERLVRADGVEGTLRTLQAAGVYLTAEEFRGGRPVRRGGLALDVDPVQLRNPPGRMGSADADRWQPNGGIFPRMESRVRARARRGSLLG